MGLWCYTVFSQWQETLYRTFCFPPETSSLFLCTLSLCSRFPILRYTPTYTCSFLNLLCIRLPSASPAEDSVSPCLPEGFNEKPLSERRIKITVNKELPKYCPWCFPICRMCNLMICETNLSFIVNWVVWEDLIHSKYGLNN